MHNRNTLSVILAVITVLILTTVSFTSIPVNKSPADITNEPESNPEVVPNFVHYYSNSPLHEHTQNSTVSKLALLVGMSDYPGEDNDLLGPLWNVKFFRSYLLSRGFAEEDIEVFYPSITRTELRDAIRDLVARSTDDTEIVFYFAGHGTAAARQSAICLYDGNVYQSELASMFSRLRSNKTLFVFDCCMAGNFADSQPLSLIMGPNSIVLTGSRDHTLSWGTNGGTGPVYGVFTYYLLNGMGGAADIPPFGDNDGQTTVEEAYRYTRVMLKTTFPHTQSPEMNDKYPGQMAL